MYGAADDKVLCEFVRLDVLLYGCLLRTRNNRSEDTFSPSCNNQIAVTLCILKGFL